MGLADHPASFWDDGNFSGANWSDTVVPNSWQNPNLFFKISLDETDAFQSTDSPGKVLPKKACAPVPAPLLAPSGIEAG